jgi:hypothetical protein
MKSSKDILFVPYLISFTEFLEISFLNGRDENRVAMGFFLVTALPGHSTLDED